MYCWSLQLLVAVKQSHERGVCHGETASIWKCIFFLFLLFVSQGNSFIFFQGTLNVRMCWSLLGTGFTLPIMHHLNPRIFHMMILLISHFSLILVEEGDVILHLRFVPFYFTFSAILYGLLD